jgi:hypothetical protein
MLRNEIQRLNDIYPAEIGRLNRVYTAEIERLLKRPLLGPLYVRLRAAARPLKVAAKALIGKS